MPARFFSQSLQLSLTSSSHFSFPGQKSHLIEIEISNVTCCVLLTLPPNVSVSCSFFRMALLQRVSRVRRKDTLGTYEMWTCFYTVKCQRIWSFRRAEFSVILLQVTVLVKVRTVHFQRFQYSGMVPLLWHSGFGSIAQHQVSVASGSGIRTLNPFYTFSSRSHRARVQPVSSDSAFSQVPLN